MLNALKKGDVRNFQHTHGDCALECAAALQLFLIHLKKPVVPFNIQRLVLADNPGIAAHDVARDALGLIRQDVRGRHGELLADILELLRFLARSAPPSECSELQGSPLPIALLPVFFRLTPDDLMKWRQVASRFSEIIKEAPESLSRNTQFSREIIPAEQMNNSRRRGTERSMRLRQMTMLFPILRFVEERHACTVMC